MFNPIQIAALLAPLFAVGCVLAPAPLNWEDMMPPVTDAGTFECPEFPHAIVVETGAGQCVFDMCEKGYGDCDESRENGCETVCPPEGECCAG